MSNSPRHRLDPNEPPVTSSMDWTTLPPPDGGTTSADEQIDAEAAPAETPGA